MKIHVYIFFPIIIAFLQEYTIQKILDLNWLFFTLEWRMNIQCSVIWNFSKIDPIWKYVLLWIYLFWMNLYGFLWDMVWYRHAFLLAGSKYCALLFVDGKQRYFGFFWQGLKCFCFRRRQSKSSVRSWANWKRRRNEESNKKQRKTKR